MPTVKPTKKRILATLSEFKEIGRDSFLQKYARKRTARNYYIRYKGAFYDMKAVWAASHKPPVPPRSFNTSEPYHRIPLLGFKRISEKERVELTTYIEGKRGRREASFFHRNPALVATAKRKYGYACMVCKFNFAKKYGSLGREFIECHHLRPMAENRSRKSSVKDVAVVCSNCHRMIHLGGELRTINELRRIVKISRRQR